MKVLVVGATGFIGQSIYNFLKRGQCFEVVAGVRDPQKFSGDALKIDFNQLEDDNELVKSLTGFDVVVNAVGIIAESKKVTFDQIHTIAPKILFDACKEVGVKKVVQVSALGTQRGTTNYHQSKNRADGYLRELGMDYAILHPLLCMAMVVRVQRFFKHWQRCLLCLLWVMVHKNFSPLPSKILL